MYIYIYIYTYMYRLLLIFYYIWYALTLQNLNQIDHICICMCIYIYVYLANNIANSIISLNFKCCTRCVWFINSSCHVLTTYKIWTKSVVRISHVLLVSETHIRWICTIDFLENESSCSKIHSRFFIYLHMKNYHYLYFVDIANCTLCSIILDNESSVSSQYGLCIVGVHVCLLYARTSSHAHNSYALHNRIIRVLYKYRHMLCAC